MFEGPYYQSVCKARYKIAVYNMKIDSSYIAHLIAYNNSITLKSSDLLFCKIRGGRKGGWDYFELFFIITTHTHTHTHTHLIATIIL